MAVLVTPMGGRLGGDKPSGTDYEQLINYTMTYDAGDECSENYGEWIFDTSLTCPNGSWNTSYMTKEDTYIKLYSASTYSSHIRKADKINFAEFSKVYVDNTPKSTLADQPLYWIASDLTSINNPILIANNTDTSATRHIWESDVSGCDEEAYFFICQWHNRNTDIHRVWFTKADNYTKLCELANVTAPSTLEELLADTTSLATIFNSEEAVKFMVKQCTGDFLASVIADETVLALLEEAPYYTLVQANEHWAKFLAMVA